MKYLVEATPTVERANAMDKTVGPKDLFGHIAKRFKPEAFYASPFRRQLVMIVDLPTEEDVAELMLILVRNVDREPHFTPLMDPARYGAAIAASNAALLA